MYTLLKPIPVRDVLLKQHIHLFTPRLFAQLFHTTPVQTKYFLETQVKNGFLTRMKKGLYSLKTDPPSEEEIANALYQPSYLSFEYAMAYHNLIPEMPYLITSATTKTTRLFSFGLQSFSYRSLKTPAYTGYSLVKHTDRSFLIASPEKACIDYLYFVSLKKISLNDRINLNSLDRQKLIQYSLLFQYPPLNRLLKQLL